MTATSEGQLPAGVVRETSPPERIVLLWSSHPVDGLIGPLVDSGHLPLVLEPAETLAFIESSGAPALLLVDADRMDPASAAALGSVRSFAPHLRVCVLAGRRSGPDGLLQALRAGISETVDPDDPAAVAALAGRPGGPVERVLAVGAHPDDVEIGCAATLLRHRAQGHPVSVLTLSRGQVGGTTEQRRSEAVSAAVGMSAELLMADLPDTRLEDAHEMVGLIEGVIAATAPTTVYVHSEHDNHQDHRAVHRATVIAARRVQQLFCYQSPSSRNGFAPTRFVPVDATIDDKVAILAKYRSQSTRHYLEPDLVIATGRYWARQLPHARYAEPFEVIRASEHQAR